MPMDRLISTTTTTSAALFLLVLLTGRTVAQYKFDVKAHYSKSERMVPMRDGVKLFTIVNARFR